ncbi:hypothetical protein Lfu02_03560 [Longispora fulva]|uniref:Acid phosphatase n=1 Tax=Longispora fulva TaxID=619741 RepID=A0A8J7GCJ7_9ACTN|nr:alkaline phosphatase family protein [Longispora fulva]MBG6135775.1 hypothetical protein [Longispora fulva]GIG55984.1 hypothetical protein Lfu02_03560 [Longispora fulva]
MFRRQVAFVASAVAALATVGAGVAMAAQPPTGTAAAVAAVPRPDHVVIVVFENTDYADIIGNPSAPYFNSLAGQGASFTQSFGVTHPSQGNYVAMFSGSQQGVTDDTCPRNLGNVANLGSQLIGAGFTFKGYSESMPSDGYTGCSSGNYARKHNPWVDFSNVPAASNVRFSAFPTDYTTLPTVSYVVPDMCNDIHDCPIQTGDTWLRDNLDGYAQWAKTHNSLLITTFDEDNFSSVNQIATIMVGQKVVPGAYSEQINHYNVLRTLEDAYGLSALGNAASATPITDIWSTTTPSPTPSASPTRSPSPTPGPTKTPTPSPTSTSGCANPGQKLGNPSFETGTAAPWTASAGVLDNGTTQPAHSGSWKAWLDGYGSAHTDTLSQSVTLPAGCASYTLSFWLHIDTDETESVAYDTLTVMAGTTTLATYSNTNAATGYTQRTFDLKAFAGQTVTLKLTGVEDSTLKTSFVVDDAALTVS